MIHTCALAVHAVEMLFGRYISDYVKPQSLHMRGNGKNENTGDVTTFGSAVVDKLPIIASSPSLCGSCRDAVSVW